MSKRTVRTVFSCTECGTSSAKWVGRCPACEAWNSLVEEVVVPRAAAGGTRPAAEPMLVGDIDPLAATPASTGVAELDRVLGGGLVPGSVTLLGGEPGIGKSTLLLQLLAGWSGAALYVSAEESAQQVRQRAERLGVSQRNDLWLLAETELGRIVEAVDSLRPSIVVVDSVQSIADPELGSPAGSVVQVRACTQQLVAEAKARGVAVVLVGHVTKDGALAGPRVLEHAVDTVLSFEGDRQHALRFVRAVKHRFGAIGELGLFDMQADGLRGVPDASAVLLTDRRPGIAGSVAVATVEGHRPLLVEVQALTNPVPQLTVPPRRSAQGLDPGRLALLLAVLDRRAGLSASAHEVYSSAVGGVRLTEPGSDLGVCMAVASAMLDEPLPDDVVVFGEIGLGGELRQVPHADRRLKEAARLGFRSAVVPASCTTDAPGMRIMRVATLSRALAAVGLDRSGTHPSRGAEPRRPHLASVDGVHR